MEPSFRIKITETDDRISYKNRLIQRDILSAGNNDHVTIFIKLLIVN